MEDDVSRERQRTAEVLSRTLDPRLDPETPEPGSAPDPHPLVPLSRQPDGWIRGCPVGPPGPTGPTGPPGWTPVIGGSYTMAGPTSPTGPTGPTIASSGYYARTVYDHDHICPMCRVQIGTARTAWMAWLGMFTAHILTEHSDVVMVTR